MQRSVLGRALLAGVLLVVVALPGASVAQNEDEIEPLFVSGVTDLRDLPRRFVPRATQLQRPFEQPPRPDGRFIVDPTALAGLATTFDISEETRIFVTLMGPDDRFRVTGEVATILRDVEADTFDVLVAAASQNLSTRLSWLVTNQDSWVAPSGAPCWAVGDGADSNGDGVVDVLDCGGPPGETGIPGEIGEHGERGDPGLAGESPRGDQGPAGVACWDLNGDGVPDEHEDVNGDGTVDLLDCSGPDDGPPGEMGEDGERGDPGLAGEEGPACWDTDADGVQDPAEDINGDGVHDASDCTGPAGAPGDEGPQGPPGAPSLGTLSCGPGDVVIGFEAGGSPICRRGDDTTLVTGLSSTLSDDGFFDAYALRLLEPTTVRVAAGPLGGTQNAFHFLVDADGTVAACEPFGEPLLQVAAGDYEYFLVVDRNTGTIRSYSVAFIGGLVNVYEQVADDEEATVERFEELAIFDVIQGQELGC